MTQTEHILKYLAKGLRYDGRKLNDFRKVTIETGVTGSAEGSALVTFGGTRVMAGVKIGIDKPYPDTPDKGNLMVNVELRPMANPKFESGPPRDQAIELARVTDRGIRESDAIDVKDLVITAGEAVWSVIIDIVAINDEGNLFDAAGIAALAALKTAKFPGITELNKPDYDNRTDKPLPLKHDPVPITILRVGEHLIVDPLTVEEAASDARLTVAVMEDGSLAALQKGGVSAFTIEEVDKIVALAQEKSKMLRDNIAR